jgi:hypothetical protein
MLLDFLIFGTVIFITKWTVHVCTSHFFNFTRKKRFLEASSGVGGKNPPLTLVAKIASRTQKNVIFRATTTEDQSHIKNRGDSRQPRLPVLGRRTVLGSLHGTFYE